MDTEMKSQRKTGAVTNTNATTLQLAILLEHLKTNSNLPNVWAIVTQKMTLSESSERTEDHWRQLFENWIKRTKEKVNNAKLTGLEKDLLKFYEANETVLNTHADYSINDNCRICFAIGELESVFRELDNRLSYAEQINEIANIQPIKNDDCLPIGICSLCAAMVDRAYTFKKLIEETDRRLRQSSEQPTTPPSETIIYTINDNDEIEVHIETTETKRLHLDDDHFEMNADETQSVLDGSEFKLETLVEINALDQIVDDETDEPQKKQMGKRKRRVRVQSSPKTAAATTEKVATATTDEDHRCDMCGKNFRKLSSCNLHRRTHLSIKSHECGECAKVFKTALALKIHLRTHTNERPYVCETCGKAFKTCSAASNHRAIHSLVKEFKCALCSYCSNTKANLKIHNRTHTGVQPYECRYCPLKFSTASNKHKHMRNIHEKLKTHKCDQCDRSFFSRESARKHMVTHTGDKPYSCAECSMTYGWFNGLQKHMRIQHPGRKMPPEKSFFLDKPNTNSVTSN